MTETGDKGELDSFFAAARAETPVPTGDFMVRLEADALAAMPEPKRSSVLRAALAQLRDALGGWPGVTGLAAACAAGVWIGISPPAMVDGLWGDEAVLGTLGVDPLSGFDLALLEG